MVKISKKIYNVYYSQIAMQIYLEINRRWFDYLLYVVLMLKVFQAAK